MANQLKYVTGDQWLFADHATDFVANAPATAANSFVASGATITPGQLDLGGVADGASRQSAKVDLGASRARQFSVEACLEFQSSPTDGNVVSFYWAPSPSSTAGTGNPSAITGADAAYSQTTGLLGELIHIGDLTLRNSATSLGHVGVFEPPHRYGSLVVYNQSGQTLGEVTSGDSDELHVVLSEIIDEAQ